MIIKHQNYKKIDIFNLNDLDKLKTYYHPIDQINISIYGKSIDLSKIPNTVSAILFNYKFENKSYEIPYNIKYVYFYEFSDLLEKLPITLEYITIHKGFNNPVNNLGNNFKLLNFGYNFNQPVDNLPSSLEKVVFSINFIHSINNLPHNIKFIHIFNPNYNFNSINKLPKSLILLQVELLNDNFELDFNFDLNGKKYINMPAEKINNKIQSSHNKNIKNYYFYKE